MSVEVADVVSPKGRLRPELLWPDLSPSQRTTKLQGFLDDAALQDEITGLSTAALQDRVTTLWVERRAKVEVLDEMIVSPSSATFADEGSGSYSAAQITALQQQVVELDAAITELIEGDTATDEGAYGAIQSYR